LLKTVGVVLIVAVAVALIYPGIPAGAHIAGDSRKMTCNYLYWSGIRQREYVFGPRESMGNLPCYSIWFGP
jgi:hypothetical protein